MRLETRHERKTTARLLAIMVICGATFAIANPFGGVPNPPVSGAALSASQMNQNFAALTTYINGLEERVAQLEASRSGDAQVLATLAPSGSIVAYGGPEVPNGWLPCDGRELDGRSPSYAALYQSVGVTFGGNPSTSHFRIPDLRGRFVRGLDRRMSGALDPDAPRTMGSEQGDLLRSHGHDAQDLGHTHPYNGVGGHPFNEAGVYAQCDCAPSGQKAALVSTGYAQIQVASSGGVETRPVNMALQYIIKL